MFIILLDFTQKIGYNGITNFSKSRRHTGQAESRAEYGGGLFRCGRVGFFVVTVVIKDGVFLLELNRIYNEDCLDGLARLDDNTVDLIVTSPPYYNAKAYSQYADYGSYMEFLRSVFALCLNKLKESRMCCVNISTIIVPRACRSAQSTRLALPFHFVNMMERIGYEFLEDIVWVKPEGAAKNRNGGFYCHRQPVAYKPNVVNEYVFVFKKPSKYLIDKVVRAYSGEVRAASLVADGYERSNVWHINPDTSSKHPAPFPVELSDKLIQYYSYVGDVVVDPFMGGGTTAVSAKKLKRSYIGFELNAGYAELAQKRLTGTIFS